MAELVAAAVPELLRPEQAAQHYSEAVRTAVAACAEDTAGQRCYICLEAVHPDTNEGLVRGCACRGGAGFAHVSCLARQAQVAVERDAQIGWPRWMTCRQCEQKYHGVVACALGWACWKTYVGRPETDEIRGCAMNVLGRGLHEAEHDEDALSVQEALLFMLRRLGVPEETILATQSNLATTYSSLGRKEEASQMYREVYHGTLGLLGEEHAHTLLTANNYANCLFELRRFEEAKELLRKVTPVARRVLGGRDRLTLKMRWHYARALYQDPDATLYDLREAVATLEDIEPIARRVFGGTHPMTTGIEGDLRIVRTALRARAMQTTTLPPSWIASNALVTGETEEQLMARLRREAKEINAAVAREAAEAKARLRNELPGYDEPG